MAEAAQPDFQMLQEHLQGVAVQLNNRDSQSSGFKDGFKGGFL